MATFAEMGIVPETKREDGKRYGRLFVVREAGRTRGGAVTWLCTCDCGGLVEVAGSDLRRAHTTSCGCVQRDAVAASNVLKPRGHWQKLRAAQHATGQ
jgi:hypothetical protein